MKNKIFKTLLLSASLSLKAYSMHEEFHCEEKSHKSQGQIFSQSARDGLQGKEYGNLSQFQYVPESERFVRLAIEMILESLRLQEMAKNSQPVSANIALNAGQNMFADLIQNSVHNYNYEYENSDHNFEHENYGHQNSNHNSKNQNFNDFDNSLDHNYNHEYENSNHNSKNQNFNDFDNSLDNGHGEGGKDRPKFTINIDGRENVPVFDDKHQQYYYVDENQDRIFLDGEYSGKVFEDGELKLSRNDLDNLYYDVKTKKPFTGKFNGRLFNNGKKILEQRNGIMYDCETENPANGKYAFPNLFDPDKESILTFKNGEFVN